MLSSQQQQNVADTASATCDAPATTVITGHCQSPQDTDENKLCYTQVFQEYCELLERTIITALTAAVPGFSLDVFTMMLQQRQGELGAEVSTSSCQAPRTELKAQSCS